MRIKNGIKEELLALIRLKGVGRVRARKLWSSGVHSIADLKKVPQPALERILGEKVAADVREQLGATESAGLRHAMSGAHEHSKELEKKWQETLE